MSILVFVLSKFSWVLLYAYSCSHGNWQVSLYASYSIFVPFLGASLLTSLCSILSAPLITPGSYILSELLHVYVETLASQSALSSIHQKILWEVSIPHLLLQNSNTACPKTVVVIYKQSLNWNYQYHILPLKAMIYFRTFFRGYHFIIFRGRKSRKLKKEI